MLSFGIRFGQGFDKISLLKVMQSVPLECDYDFLVLGCNPGGIAAAREASAAGKKTAIVKWNRYTPAEEEGFDENLEEMADVLGVTGPKSSSSVHLALIENSSDYNIIKASSRIRRKRKNSLGMSLSSVTQVTSKNIMTKNKRSSEKATRSRKVRQSRLDLNNELYKRGQEARKLMHIAANLSDALEDARNCGWRLAYNSQATTMNWNKMSEQVMDFIMKENWELMSLLGEESIEVIEGYPVFLNNHVVKIISADSVDQEISADIICAAPSAEYIFPEDVSGAEDFGINPNDFIRLSEPPGKTLIVGATPEGLECAGIIACCGFSVAVVSRSKILKGYDSEMSELIVADLKKRNVTFFENTTLISLEESFDGTVLATFIFEETPITKKFDTVIFAVGTYVSLDFLNLKAAGIEIDSNSQKINTDQKETTTAPNIYAVGDVVAYQPEGHEIAELTGTLLGKRLFHNETALMDYSMIPFVMYTPIEYASIGLSEDSASYRLGNECIKVLRGCFKPVEYKLTSKRELCSAKIIALASRDLIIGLHLFGPDAGEIIQGFATAIKNGLTLSQLHGVVGVHSTKAKEILKLKGSTIRQNVPEGNFKDSRSEVFKYYFTR